MKKFMLCSFLSILFINSYSQDTICTYFTGEDVFEFDYQTSEPVSYDLQTTKFYTIKLGYRQVLCLDLSDKKKRFRKIIIHYDDGEKTTQILDSNDITYYTPNGSVRVEVGKPRLFKI